VAVAVADWLYSEIFACLPFLHAFMPAADDTKGDVDQEGER